MNTITVSTTKLAATLNAALLAAPNPLDDIARATALARYVILNLYSPSGPGVVVAKGNSLDNTSIGQHPPGPKLSAFVQRIIGPGAGWAPGTPSSAMFDAITATNLSKTARLVIASQFQLAIDSGAISANLAAALGEAALLLFDASF